jgi:hypothetical protein
MDVLLVGIGIALLVAAIVGEAVTIGGSGVPKPRNRQIRVAFGILGIVLMILGLIVNGAIKPPDGDGASPSPSVSASPSASIASPSIQPSTSAAASPTPSASVAASPRVTPSPTASPTPSPTIAGHGPWRGMPARFNDGIDAAVVRSTGQMYFFDGRLYVRFNDLVSGMSSGPIVTADNWHGLNDEFAARIDAACTGTDSIYLFRNESYVTFSEDLTKSASPPRSIATDWPGLPSSFVSKIDAAFTDAAGRIYLFRGDQYVRFSNRTSGVDAGYPEPIANRWQGMPDSFNSGIDAAFMTHDGATWFFRGPEYVRFAPAQFTVDPGYPRPIDQ